MRVLINFRTENFLGLVTSIWIETHFPLSLLSSAAELYILRKSEKNKVSSGITLPLDDNWLDKSFT